ncbi:glycosyltransferase [Desulfobacterales bacterium HSG2]|nr:glycosyltransferase [Desulfobacterales bacterium HSG2]
MTSIFPKQSIRLSRWLPFAAASCFFFFLCLKGGFFGFIGAYPLEIPIPFVAERIVIPGGKFILLFSSIWLACILLLLLYPRGLSDISGKIILLILAAVCRIAFLFHEPSDDIFRYLWEGRLICQGINPYVHAPDDPALAELAARDPFHRRINHPDMPAAYPPLTLIIFAVTGLICYNPMAIKILISLFDLTAIYYVFLLLQHRKLDVRWAILYAFNPVILLSFSGQGHFDVIQITFMLAAIHSYDRKKWPGMFIFLGLAVQIKYVAAMTIPFFIRRENLKSSGLILFVVGVPYLPFVETILPLDGGRVFHSLFTFGSEFAFNGSVHGLLRAMLQGISPATRICSVLFLVSLAIGLVWFHPVKNPRFGNDPVSGCFFAMGAILIFSPTVHFWYLSWMIPFLALRPTASWIVLCLTVSGYFIANGIAHHTGEWRLPVWAQVSEWLPFWLLFFRDIYFAIHRGLSRADTKSPQTLSVVIPVLNEGERIIECIASIRRDPAVNEVIVADGGSSDQTALFAEQAGATILTHKASIEKGGGRGGQIGAGVRAATGDVIAIVHADARIRAPVFSKILSVLKRQPMICGGAVGCVFNESDWRLRILEFANDFRMVCLGISFGDQVQFFRKRPVTEGDVFPDIPLMEDVELSLRLHRLGRQIFLFGDIPVSARRWKSKGYMRSLQVIRLVSSYLWQRMWRMPDTVSMYRKYYGQ